LLFVQVSFIRPASQSQSHPDRQHKTRLSTFANTLHGGTSCMTIAASRSLHWERQCTGAPAGKAAPSTAGTN
jgi:hypothetical protein